MTNSPVSTFQDILDALERDPALRETLRRHILSEELLQIPAQVHALQADVGEIKASVQRLDEGQQEIRVWVQRLDEGQQEIRADLAQVSGTVSRLAGTDYESAAARYADRLARRNMNLENAVVVARAKGAGSTPPLPEGDQAAREGRIEWGEADDLAMADVIVAADTLDGEPVFVLAEISMTVQERDRSAAFRRADILERATGRRALSAVIGITEEAPETGPIVAFFPFDPEGAAVR